MNDMFIRERISNLRLKKGVSEYKMSLDLGHSKSYIQSISSGKALPSLTEFLYICDYLGVTPKEFFDDENVEPILYQELCITAKDLCAADLEILTSLAKRLSNQ